MSGILNLLLAGAASVVKDAYFNLVTLLLNTTSTNGAQNNTFLDSSSNNFSITRNGNTTQGTFTPFSQTGWSNKLSSGNNLSSPSNAGYQFDSGNFTVEGWIYFNTVGNAQFLSIPVVGALYWQYFAGALDFGNNAGGSVQASWSPVANTWYHVAAVRNGGTFTNYINGAVHSSGSAFNVTATGTLQVGYGGAGSFDGYLSNVRIVKGTAVYTAAFTPPTAPLTAISGTQLLICQSNRFADSSTNALTLTVNGTPSVQAFSPFAPTTAYDTAVVGGSGYFDGNGDYLNFLDTTQSGSTSNFDMGGIQASWDFWAYITTTSSSIAFAKTANAVSSWNDIQYIFYPYESGSSTFFFRNGANYALVQGTFPAKLNSWAHFVVSTDVSNNISIYVNGTRLATTNNTIGKPSTANYIGIGSQSGATGGGVMNGYISGMRFIRGSGAFSATTSTITVPTAPPTAVSGTQLLLNYTNAGIYDSAAKNDLETVGNAQVSTTQAKWGTTSMYFDGTGDYLYAGSATANNIMSLGTGDFTVETWVNFSNISNNPCICSGYVDASNGWYFQYYSNNIEFALGSTALISRAATVSNGTWYHMAVTRSGGTLRAFLDGVQQGTSVTGNTSNLNVTNGFYVGILNSSFAPTTRTFAGYLDDLRITKGYARYTANFTPPAAAFPIQ